MPKVSVVIASYNHAKYVADTLQSVLDQTYQDFEIVITDDGSKDETVEEIKKFTDPRIKLFCFEKNQGACVALNNCIHRAGGEYIAVVNSDDMFCEGKLQKQVDFLDAHKEIGAVFGYPLMVDEDENELKSKRHTSKNVFRQPNRSRYEWLRHFFYFGNCLCHPTVLIRKSCYNNVGLYDPRLAQIPDFDFWIRLCFNYEIFIMPEFLIKFRILSNEQNASSKGPQKTIRRYNEASQIYQHYLKIQDEKELLRIFPESQIYIKGEPLVIPYILSRLALDTQDSDIVKQLFAIDTIYRMLGDKNTAAKLAKRFNFTYSDFIKLTGQHDVFNIVRVKELQSMLRNPLRVLISSITGRGSKGKV